MNNTDDDIYYPKLNSEEHHFNKYPDHPWLKSKEDIKNWLTNDNVKTVNVNGDFIINDDLTVEIWLMNNSKIKITNTINGYIPVQFRFIDSFECSNIGLKSLIGTPYYAEVINADNNLINDWNGVSSEIEATLSLRDNLIESFKGMPVFSLSESVDDEGWLSLDIRGNPINSWEGLTYIEAITLPDAYSNDEELTKLLCNAPNFIKSVLVSKSFRDNNQNIKTLISANHNLNRIDDKWLKDFKKVNDIYNSIKIDGDRKDGRKRKI